MPLPLLASGILGGLLAGLARLVVSRAGIWVLSAMAFIGLEWITFEGVMEPIMDYVQSAAGGAGGISGDLAGWMGVLNIDKYITIVTSAFLVGAGKRAILAKRNG